MPSKRKHTKSRLGCKECKGRHIRCDQAMPICGPCTRKGIECEYRLLVAQASHPIQILTSESFGQRNDSVVSASNGSPKKVDVVNSSGPGVFSAEDVLLMHRYTISTSQTIGVIQNPAFTQVWQSRVPKLSLAHPFLLHAILSISAAHASNQPLARHHYSHALETFNASAQSPLLPDQTDAIFCYCILIMLIHSALDCSAPKASEEELLDSLVSLCGIVRSAVSMLSTVESSSEIRGLLLHLRGSSISRKVPPALLDRSLNFLDMTIASQRLTFTPEEMTALRNTVFKLRQFFTLVDPRPEDWRHLMQWPVSLSPDFLEMLRGRREAALAIFALWCVPVNFAPKKWYVERWPGEAVRTIGRKLAGGAYWGCVQWAVDTVGDGDGDGWFEMDT